MLSPVNAYPYRRGLRSAALFGLALLAALALAVPAGAAVPEFLFQVPGDSTAAGAGAGRFASAAGIATDPTNGHLFVIDANNSRISELTAWGKFVKSWGWDVAPDGSPGDTPADQLEICTAICKAGVEGNGAGQVNRPKGITLDAVGNVYLFEANLSGPLSGQRVQKFDSAGNFLLMFGGEVDKTTSADICTKADLEGGDECGAGVVGTADGWFSNESFGNYITHNPVTDTVFVGDKDRIQEFNLDGSFKAKIDFEGELQAFDGRLVKALAADPLSGDLYFALRSTPPKVEHVYELDPESGALLDEDLANGKAPYPGGLAVDAEGNVFVLLDRYTANVPGTIDSLGEVLGFDPTGKPIAGMELGDEFATAPLDPATGNRPIHLGIATNVLGPGSEEPGDLYVAYFGQGSYLNAYGPAPVAFEDPPALAPEISAQYATSVGTDGAKVRAEINPHFWQDATYYVQYGTKACLETGWEGPACERKPLAGGALLSANAVNAPVKAAVSLEGLEPDTTYHFRFIAESGGGGPVVGLGGKLGEDGPEATFKTFALSGTSDSCPANGKFRLGPAAFLPDCRGYELVSPLEKNGGNGVDIDSRHSEDQRNQSATSGEKLTYTSKTSFGDSASTPSISQYLSSRGTQGWSTEAISPPRTLLVGHLEIALSNEFQDFSPDLCSAWLRHEFEPVLAPDAVQGYPNLYRRESCTGAPSYEALTTVEPPNRTADRYYQVRALGSSTDGTHTIFTANAKLTEAAPALGENEPQLYEHVAGDPVPHFVCILPNENPSSQACGAGAPGGVGGGNQSNVQGAISADGSRIFWTAYTGALNFASLNRGRIYARVDGIDTAAISQSVTPEPSLFWGAAKDGSKSIFEVDAGPLEDNLYEVDVDKALAKEADAATLIAKGVVGLAGMSEDASRIYLASREVLSGEAENSEGEKAQAGQPNLYLYEEGAFTFIATLAGADNFPSEPNPLRPEPFSRAARVSADGSEAAFISRGRLTGYDNTDVTSGKADAEVFLYDADQAKLRCVSCNPTGARPAGIQISGNGSGVAATIPAWERPQYASRLLSSDGRRLFFESYEALVPHDTNGVLDVYQWEAAGKGGCDEADPTYGEEAEGCVDLISSGESAEGSKFLDADPSGENVFIATLASLVPRDYGLIDVYDVRVDGGFPEPPAPPPCEGDSCQSPRGAPNDPTPASSSFKGPGNVGQKPSCPKGKRKVRKAGKTRCLKKQKRQHKRAKRAQSNRRAGR